MILQLMGAFVAVAAVAILVETPRKYLWCAGAVASAGWLIFLLCRTISGNEILATFFSAVVITILSHMFARILKAPVTVFLVAGIYPTVPGAGMYRIAYHLIAGESNLAAHYLVTTLELAGAIALGIFVVDGVFRLFQKRSCKTKGNRID